VEKIKIILVDDHHIVREGINILLMNVGDIEVIGEASDSDELFELLRTQKPDILLMDISMPKMSGIEISHIISHDYPDIKVIILTADSSEGSVFEALKAGACGYLPKNVKRNELLEAIHRVAEGEEYLAGSFTGMVFRTFMRYARKEKAEYEKEEPLSKRELEIVKLFAEGLSYKEIADRMNISVRTVESHKNHIMEKLGLRSIVDLVKYAIKQGIIRL
jgi:DNA-binding NarL/FixJ family response regulator